MDDEALPISECAVNAGTLPAADCSVSNEAQNAAEQMDGVALAFPDGSGDLAAPSDLDEALARKDAKHALKVAGQVAAATVLATSLVAVLTEPPRADLMTLPEPTPIVQQFSPYIDDVEPEGDEDDEDTNRWKRVLKILRYLAVALLMASVILFGALKGCAGCSAALLLPEAEEEQQEEA